MARAQKMLLALAIAIVLHAAILLLSLTPRLAGLTSPVELSAGGEQAIDIGWATAAPDVAQTLSRQLEAIEAIQRFKLAPPLPTVGEPGAGSPTVVSGDSEYASRVRQHLARFAGALPAGAVGEARVQFVVQPDGRVSEVLLVKPSGNEGLDAVARSLPAKAQPLPLPGPEPQRLEVPVQAVATSAAP